MLLVAKGSSEAVELLACCKLLAQLFAKYCSVAPQGFSSCSTDPGHLSFSTSNSDFKQSVTLGTLLVPFGLCLSRSPPALSISGQIILSSAQREAPAGMETRLLLA